MSKVWQKKKPVGPSERSSQLSGPGCFPDGEGRCTREAQYAQRPSEVPFLSVVVREECTTCMGSPAPNSGDEASSQHVVADGAGKAGDEGRLVTRAGWWRGCTDSACRMTMLQTEGKLHWIYRRRLHHSVTMISREQLASWQCSVVSKPKCGVVWVSRIPHDLIMIDKHTGIYM